MEWLTALSIPLLPIVLLVAVMQVLGRIGGWTKLADLYRHDQTPQGRLFTMQSIQFRWVGYNNCITLGATNEGLFIAIWGIFRWIGHPNLLIPWDELHNPQEKKIFGFKFVRVDVGTPALTNIRIPLKILEAKQTLSNPVG